MKPPLRLKWFSINAIIIVIRNINLTIISDLQSGLAHIVLLSLVALAQEVVYHGALVLAEVTASLELHPHFEYVFRGVEEGEVGLEVVLYGEVLLQLVLLDILMHDAPKRHVLGVVFFRFHQLFIVLPFLLRRSLGFYMTLVFPVVLEHGDVAVQEGLELAYAEAVLLSVHGELGD